MDLMDLSAGGEPPAPALTPERMQDRVWRSEVWGYATFMAVALSVVAWLLTGDLLLVLPVVLVCALAGLAGTILSVQRSRLRSNEHSHYESIYR